MTKTATATAGIILMALVALPLLSGCTAADTLSRPATESALSTAAPVPIEGDTNGDGKLSEFEKQVLARDAPRDIVLDDGTVVVVTPGQPLPDRVIEQIVADAAPGAAQAQTDDEFTPMAGIRTLREVAASYAEQLGGTLVIVYWGLGTWDTVSSVDEAGGTGLAGASDQSVMVAAATKWANSHDAYLVVVE